MRELEARLEVSEAQRREAEARVELQGCLLLLEQLAHARLRDSLLGKFCEGVSVHISGVLERLAVILGVLSVSKHGTIAWCQWFCALRSSKNHHTHP